MSNSEDARSALRERYLEVSTPTVSDVLEKLGHMDQVLFSKIKPVTVGRVAGWAYTVSGRMARYEPEGGDPEKLEACEGIGPNEVSVWSGGGTGICYFGDLVSASMQQRGSTGAVLDGGIRDTAALEEIGFATFATYQSSAQSIGRWKVDEWQVPITLPGATTESVQITPGDFITGDQDGVVVVPSGMEEEVIAAAESLEESDGAIREALVDGISASEARAKFGHL